MSMISQTMFGQRFTATRKDDGVLLLIVHCDSCENSFDNPLLYEKGWGKKLTYVIAFGDFDVKDVTRRYSENISELIPRRTSTTEARLSFHMMNFTREKRFGVSESLLKECESRDLQELKELETVPKIDWKLMVGRQSGSIEWRLDRGEMGS